MFIHDPEALAPEEYGIKVDAYDELLPAEPLLEKDGMIVRAQIAGCKRDSHGNLIGQYNPNPLLNTCVRPPVTSKYTTKGWRICVS